VVDQLASDQVVVDEGRSALWVWHRLNTRESYAHLTNKHSPATSIGWGVIVSATWGRFGGSGDDAVTQRKCYSFRAAGNTKFGQDVTDMRFDRGWTYAQSSGDLRIIQSLNHQG